MAEASDMLPGWVRFWYAWNLLVLSYDWLFVFLRPRSLASHGGDLAFLFPAFQLYAEWDGVFANIHDPILEILYYIMQPVQLLSSLYFTLRLGRAPSLATLVLLVADGVFCATKTVIYVAYSWKFVVDRMRVALSVLNGTWIAVPLLVAATACHAIFAHTVVTATTKPKTR